MTCLNCEILKSQNNELLLRKIEKLERYIETKMVSCDEFDEIIYNINRRIESLDKNIKSKPEETNCEPICSSGFNVKKTKVSFEEAISAFKKGKLIKFTHPNYKKTFCKGQQWELTFNEGEMFSNDWDFVE